MSKNTLTITDNRTGKAYEVPVQNDTIKAIDLRQIKVNKDDFGLMTYDPAYMNTASCKSNITYIDGDKGILRYRGYPIEQLAEKSSYLEVAYLLIYGELPDTDELEYWTSRIMRHTFIHESLFRMMQAYRYDSHPMGTLISSIAGMSTLYPEAKNIEDPQTREKQIWRILGMLPTMAAFAYRHRIGRHINYPRNNLDYTSNFFYMLDFMNQPVYEVNEVIAKALDILFILHADHEQNCSTSVMRSIGSSGVDPFSALAGASSALYGPLHGGANEKALRMLKQIGDPDNVDKYVEKVKLGEVRLMGFGHRVYKNYDPRAKIIKKIAHDVFEAAGTINPLIEIAMKLEDIALNDDYFIERKLYPNVDFYSGIIYQVMRFPVDMYPVLFAIPRAAGWLAQWIELLGDGEQRIARPRQIYLGSEERDYVPVDQR
jgi:citrate synthase